MIKVINIETKEEVIFDGNTFKLVERELSTISAIHNSYKGVFQHGESYVNTIFESRPLQLIGLVDSDIINMETHKRNLISLFNPLNKLKIIKDEAYEIECYSNQSVKFSSTYSENNGGLCKFSVDLYCPNPYWKNNLTLGEQISTWIGGWKFKFKLPFRFKQKGESKKNIYNSGHVETPIELIFKGPALNPSIINNLTGEFIKVIRELTSDDILYITTEYGNKKVEIERNGIRANAFHYIDLDSTFFQLKVGDNMIEYTTDNNLEPQSVEIRYRNRYLGV